MQAITTIHVPQEFVPPGAPACLRAAIVTGCFWLLREIELAHLLFADIEIDTARMTVTLTLSMSKTDQSAKGAKRSWGCVCSPAKPGAPCGYHAVLEGWSYVQRHFKDSQGGAPEGTPLFCTTRGLVTTKSGVIEGLKMLVKSTGKPTLTKTGEELLGGHSMRVAGARMLAALGIEISIIMILAWWESMVVLRYIHEAPLASLTDAYKSLADRKVLPEAVRGIEKTLVELNGGHSPSGVSCRGAPFRIYHPAGHGEGDDGGKRMAAVETLRREHGLEGHAQGQPGQGRLLL